MKPRPSLQLLAATAALSTISLAPLNLHAANATWTATPTNAVWEAAGAENNWSTGAASFPGALNALTNADVATFLTSNTTTVAINSTTGNTSPLGIRGINFGVSASAPDSFTIGSAGANGGNALLLGSSGTIQIVSGATGTTTQTVNAPLILQPLTATSTGAYTISNFSAVATTSLVIAGNISAGTTTGVGAAGRVTLKLGGSNTNVNNVVSGVISDGGAASGLAIDRNGNTAGTVWSITGTNNSFTGGLTLTQGILRVATISNTGGNSSIGAGGAITVLTTSGASNSLVITGAGGSTDRAITMTRSGASSNGLSIDSSGSAPVTFSGGITGAAGSAVSTTAFQLLTLAGNNTGANTISGNITDFNATVGNEKLVAVTKSNTTAQWILSGTSSNYSGPTTISGGTLAGIGANVFGNTSGIALAGPAILSLRGDSSTSFVRTAGGASYPVTTSATSATINVDQATGAGTSAKTMTIGTLGTSSTGVTYQVNFTGANNTSLSVGAVSGAASTASATVTLANAIAGGGSLTLASYTSANTAGGDTLTFSGVGNSAVSGAVTPSATVLNVRQNGTGVVTLNGTSSYTGTTTVSTGTLVAGANAPSGSNGAFGNASSEVVLGTAGGSTDASLLISGAFTVGRDIRTPTNNTTDSGTRVLTLGGNTAANSTFSGNITLGTANQAGRGVTLTAASGGQVTFTGVIQNPASMDATSYTVTKSGLGTVVLSNTNTYTGNTTVTAGTLGLTGNSTSPVALADGTVLQLALASPVTSNSTLTFIGNATVSIIGTPVAATTYNLFTGSAISGTPALSAPISGFTLSNTGTVLQLVPSGGGGDTIKPIITLNGNTNVTVVAGATYTDAGATATDETAPANPTVTTTGTVNAAVPGVYTLSYNAVDAAGNDALTVTRTVTVVDTTKPVITLSGNATVSIAWGAAYTDAGVTATDETAPVNPAIITSGTVNTAKPGTYILSYNAVDAAGNAAITVTRTVTVAIANATTVDANGYTPLMRYALGANGPDDAVAAPVTSATASELSLTAVVRTDDPKLSVVGTTRTDLTTGTWTTTGVSGSPAGSGAVGDQTGVTTGQRRVYTVTTATKTFLRLEATLTP